MKISVVCHKNNLIFSSILEKMERVIRIKYGKKVRLKLILIDDKKIRRQTILQLMLIEIKDVYELILKRVTQDISIYEKKYDELKNVITKKELLDEIDNEDVVYMITSKYIIPEAILNKVKIYNFHCGFLPSYRGLFPTFWSYMEGNKCGITLHEIDSEIDKGKIIGQYMMKETMSYYKTLVELYHRGIDLIVEDGYENKNGQRISYHEYYKLPTIKEILKYRLKRIIERVIK